jgi:hypothetical protein
MELVLINIKRKQAVHIRVADNFLFVIVYDTYMPTSFELNSSENLARGVSPG